MTFCNIYFYEFDQKSQKFMSQKRTDFLRSRKSYYRKNFKMYKFVKVNAQKLFKILCKE